MDPSNVPGRLYVEDRLKTYTTKTGLYVLLTARRATKQIQNMACGQSAGKFDMAVSNLFRK